MNYFTFPRWAEPLLGGKPPPTPKVTEPEAETPPPPKRGRGRPKGAKNKPK
jgi:hypothetical protein